MKRFGSVQQSCGSYNIYYTIRWPGDLVAVCKDKESANAVTFCLNKVFKDESDNGKKVLYFKDEDDGLLIKQEFDTAQIFVNYEYDNLILHCRATPLDETVEENAVIVLTNEQADQLIEHLIKRRAGQGNYG